MRAHEFVTEGKIKGADSKACWKGYRYAGTKDGKDSCVKVSEDETNEDWQKVNKRDKTDGMSKKALRRWNCE